MASVTQFRAEENIKIIHCIHIAFVVKTSCRHLDPRCWSVKKFGQTSEEVLGGTYLLSRLPEFQKLQKCKDAGALKPD